jgi:2,3-bisphosphoglycerate-independent phosphoglycerate mutase
MTESPTPTRNTRGCILRKLSQIAPDAEATADLVNNFIDKAKESLSGSHPANMLLLRGFSKLPTIPSFTELYKLEPAAIACYPMYLGLSKVVGMKTYRCECTEDEFSILNDIYNEHDFFYIHIKKTDSHGEDGSYATKVTEIEKIDGLLPQILKLEPEVIVVTGDHSTPAALKGHSWHPIPLLLHSKWCRADASQTFGETVCASGILGNIQAVNIMPLAMANALKLNKFGA